MRGGLLLLPRKEGKNARPLKEPEAEVAPQSIATSAAPFFAGNSKELVATGAEVPFFREWHAVAGSATRTGNAVFGNDEC